MPRYLIRQPYYRQGVLYPPGSEVEIPDNEKPSVTWTKVEPPAPEKPASKEPSKEHPKGKRPSDGDTL